MTAGWVLVAALVCLAFFLLAVFSLLRMSSSSDEEYERLARKPYIPPGYQRTHVTVIDRTVDWARYEHEVDA